VFCSQFDLLAHQSIQGTETQIKKASVEKLSHLKYNNQLLYYESFSMDMTEDK